MRLVGWVVFLTISSCSYPGLTYGAEAANPSPYLSNTQAFPGAGPELLVDGMVDQPGSSWAAPGSPNWVEIDLGQTLLISTVLVAPFTGSPGDAYFYDEGWTVQYRNNQGNLQDFTNVQKIVGAGTLMSPGITITDGDPGSTASLDTYKFYAFAIEPVSTQHIRFTVTDGDRDGDSNGAELEVEQVFRAGDPVEFVGTANDAEDGDLNSRILWSSDRDGPLGSGGTVTASYLSVGTHMITAEVEDDAGATSTSTTEVRVIDSAIQTHSLNVSKAGTGSGTVTSSPTGINCGSDCSQDYDEGTVVNLAATPTTGSTFAGWSGTSDCNDGTVTMNGAHDCVATFDAIPPNTHTLTVGKAGTGSGTVTSSPNGINCGSDCSHDYDEGTIVALTVIAATGSTFAGWSGTNDCSDGTVTMGRAHNCTATFDSLPPDTHTLAVAKTGTGSGTVNTSPNGINCGSDCNQDYDEGTVVDLAATPTIGSTFAGWSGTNDCTDGKVTMSGYRSCNATFNSQSINTHTLTVARAGTGSGTVTSSPAGIDCGSDCSQSYAKGTVVVLDATAADGFVFSGWGGTKDCRDGRITMRNTRDCIATFDSQAPDSQARDTRTLTVSKSGAGSGTVISSPVGINCGSDCSQDYVKGTIVTLTPTAADGSAFSGWGGTRDCRDGKVRMKNTSGCVATFRNAAP